MNPTSAPDPSEAMPELWGLTASQFIEMFVPLNIGVGLAVTIIFAAVTVFGRRWRLGFAILLVGMLIVAAPIVLAGLRMNGTAAEIVGQAFFVWWTMFPRFALIVLPLAWLARWLWDDLGTAFEHILDRWGVQGAVTFIAVILAGYAAQLALRH